MVTLMEQMHLEVRCPCKHSFAPNGERWLQIGKHPQVLDHFTACGSVLHGWQHRRSSALTSGRTGPRALPGLLSSAPHIKHSLRRAALVPQEDGYDPYRLPYWIRASFIMEERWGELEAEFNAGKAAMQLAEDWGVVSIAPPRLCAPEHGLIGLCHPCLSA